MTPVRLAIIGCGAVTELYHLPAARRSDCVRVTALVDSDAARAEALAKEYHVPFVLNSIQDVMGRAEAAIVAVPHPLHASLSVELLRHGVHVLVEKPMAVTTAECNTMIDAAVRAQAVLAVGLVRRYLPSSRWVKQAIDENLLGRIREFDILEGSTYGWPAASNFYFRKESGGGVLLDTGAHTLDTLLWWLGDWESVDYYDDALGGVEADCQLRLTLRSGVRGRVELSKTRDLPNVYRLMGERGVIEVEVSGLGVSLTFENGKTVLEGRVSDISIGAATLLDAFRQQLDDFAGAIAEHRPPFVPGEEGKRAVSLIEACYAARRPLHFPWMQFSHTY